MIPVSDPVTTSAFELSDNLAAKNDTALIAGDERHFAAIESCLEQTITGLTDRVDAARREPGGSGQEAMDRDLEVHRLSARLRTLRRYGLDLCLGHMVGEDGTDPVYVGRLGLTDSAGRRLLLDWRSPAAEPFFGATHANPMGLASRRRYRWTKGRITDFWDEVFDAEGFDGHAAALDDQSAFIASLGSSRSPRMRDVLGTIQADQDAIIRAGSRGALVVDGGPGTGKTVVALHRTAYLLYADPRLGHRRGGVLFVGPHQPYLAYVADVLPSLGEEGVRTCTLRELVPEGATAAVETDPEVARLKASARSGPGHRAGRQAVRGAAHRGDGGRDPLGRRLAECGRVGPGVRVAGPRYAAQRGARPDLGGAGRHPRRQAGRRGGLARPAAQVAAPQRGAGSTLGRSWPLLEAADLVGDLWSVPAYLRMCAPRLDPEQVRRLQRPEPQAWTVSDLPLLDAARQRLGDPESSRRNRRREATLAAEREEMSRVVDELIATDDSDLHVMSMLRGDDLRDKWVDEGALPDPDTDVLAGPFAHIVVDEAQELTDAEWQMLLRRCPSRSLTIVGDRAQARHGFTESWQERLERVGLAHVELASLSINYRTPEEVMAEAEPVIRAALPDANVPTSIRSSGSPVVHGSASDLRSVLDSWLAEHTDGIACVISVREPDDVTLRAPSRVRWLSPELSKGMEFDLVVLVDPEAFGDGIEGAVDRYVAMTRATQRLVVLSP